MDLAGVIGELENKSLPHTILYIVTYRSIHSMTATTVRIDVETKALISDRKNHPRESLEDVIKRMITVYDMDRHLSDGERKGVERGMQDVRARRIIPSAELRKKLVL